VVVRLLEKTSGKMKIHLFETGVQRIADALNIQNLLALYFNHSEINFDIADYDGRGEMTLRIKSLDLEPQKVTRTIKALGYSCREVH